MDNTRKVYITRYKQGEKVEIEDQVIIEKSLNIFINNEYYSTLMCTPPNLVELTTGFLFSEGIIESKKDIKDIEFSTDDIVFVNLNKELKTGEQNFRAIVSGCGRGALHNNIIGQNNMGAVTSSCVFNSQDILRLMKDFNTRSDLFQKTGGVHSCCICSNSGIEVFTEDIGRHNAIDKAIGKCIQNGIDMVTKMLFTTGRISSDSVLKAARAGIPVLVSHSGPTDLAVDIARNLNMTMIGFVRGNRMNIYWGFDRVV